jgi:hypothetical protein
MGYDCAAHLAGAMLRQTSPRVRLALRTLAGALTGFGVGIATDAKNGAGLLARPELLGFAAAGALGVIIAELADLATRPLTKDDLFRGS